MISFFFFFYQEVNNSNSPVIMAEKSSIFIFNTITLMSYLTSKFYFVSFCLTTINNQLFFQKIKNLSLNLTDSQPSNLNRTWATLIEHCRTRVGSIANNNSDSLTELLIRPLCLSVDGKYTPWIAYMGNQNQQLNKCLNNKIIPFPLNVTKHTHESYPNNYFDSKYIFTIAKWYQLTCPTIRITSIQTLNQALGGIQNKRTQWTTYQRQYVNFW